ncbi:MAG: PTS 2-O-a-mannosyl-D-glycerate transporter subunit IIABC [Alphaproteobacteria bacterium]|nr:PTS 2-O-a-mannosyl-D-glycerate transporter subunit IIABC [Alphaproteobacteria bacterium]
MTLPLQLSKLTNNDLILLNQSFPNQEATIKALVEKLFQAGKISNKELFLADVLARETISSTNIAENLAIPHAKSAHVIEPSFAMAICKNNVADWQDYNQQLQPVKIVILLAVPDTQGNTTHLQLLTSFATKLANADYMESLLNATTTAEVLTALDATPTQNSATTQSNKLLLAITACTAGIAHTYMAAEKLEQAAMSLGLTLKTQKQGANGIDGEFSTEDLSKAHAIIYAADVPVKNKELFLHIPFLEVSTSYALKNSTDVIKQAIKIGYNQKSAKPTKKISFVNESKKAILSGISYVVPVIVAGGMILAIAVLMREIFGLQHLWDTKDSWLNMYRNLSGGLLGTLMIPILSAYIAYSLGDKVALAPGFTAGLAANMIQSGFLGGLLGGFIAGIVIILLKKYIRGSKTFQGFFMFFLYPVLSCFIVGTIMLFVLGKPVAILNLSLVGFLDSLSGGNAIILGIILGIMVSFDLGGPVNKAAYAFCLGALASGNFVPYAIFASCKMVSAFSCTMATKVAPKYFLVEEREVGKSTWILGLAGITEGAIPLALNDPLRVLGSFIAGSAITGAIVAYFGIKLQVPGAGIISMFVMEGNTYAEKLWSGIIWLLAGLLGAIISTVLLLALKGRKYHKGAK